jgi:hypothetical protein
VYAKDGLSPQRPSGCTVRLPWTAAYAGEAGAVSQSARRIRSKERHYPAEVILSAVRWYLRYPLAYLHVSELLGERDLFVDASCVWRWVQAYAPEINKRCRPRLKSTNKSYRIDETYIKVKGKDRYLSGGRFGRADD